MTSVVAALHAHGGWSSWPLDDRLALLGDLVGKLEELEDPLTVADASTAVRRDRMPEGPELRIAVEGVGDP